MARRLLLAALAAILMSSIGATAVLAGEPSCLGESVSAAATASGRDLGQLVALTATISTQGVGDEVQLILAGEFPDEAFPNTCND
jgi:hypothetical protein